MKLHRFHRGRSARPDGGFTLLELIIATAILLVLSSMVVPMTRVVVQREREKQLRND
jgi:prepilin-type N-terminal cleavage/methylation domain-containing protein